MDVSVPGWMLGWVMVMVMVMVIVFDTREKEFVAGSLSGSSVRVTPSLLSECMPVHTPQV